MKHTKMVSPNGKSTILVGPDRIDYLIANGWTIPEKKQPKLKKVK